MRVGLLLAAVSCGDAARSPADGNFDPDRTGGLTTQASTQLSTDEGHATTLTGATTLVDDPIDCQSDGDCDGFGCLAGQCRSCEDFPDGCTQGELCISDRCARPEDLTSCEAAGYSICGDGKLQPAEACDGTQGCQDCVSPTSRSRPFGEPLNASSIAIGPDGRIAALVVKEDNSRHLMIADPDTTVRSEIELADDTGSPVWGVDQVFVKGYEDGHHVEMAMGTDGQLRWSRAFALLGQSRAALPDGCLLLGGSVDQVNSNLTRGILVRLSAEGETLWEAKQSDIVGITSLATVEDGVVFAGPHIGLPRTVVRHVQIEDGTTLWSNDATPSGAAGRATVFRDTSDGAWLFDTRGNAIHFAVDGTAIDTIPCFGAVRGSLVAVSRGPSAAVALRFHAYVEGFQEPQTWLVTGMPDVAQMAGTDEHNNVVSMAWTPEGKLLTARSDDPRLHEVSF